MPLTVSHPIITRWLPLTLILTIGLLTAALLLHATSRFGPGLAPDSAPYVNGARALAQGRGYTQLWPFVPPQPVPITKYPPGYSALLACGSLLGMDAVPFSRYLAAAFLAASVLFTGALTWRATGSRIVAVIASVLVAFAPDLIEVYAFTLSESTFIVLLLICLAALATFLDHPTTRWLILAALAASAAALTRYIGLILPPMGAVLILLWSNRPARRRWIDAGLYAAGSSLASLIWMLRNRLAGGSAASRSIEWHPMNWRHVQALFQTLTQWSLPAGVEQLWWIAGVLIAFIVIALFMSMHNRGGALHTPSPGTPGEGRGEGDLELSGRMIERLSDLKCDSPITQSPDRTITQSSIPNHPHPNPLPEYREREPESHSLPRVLLAFTVTYIPALMLSISFVDSATPMDSRLLSPILIPLIVLGSWVLVVLSPRIERPIPRHLLRGVLGLLACGMLLTDLYRTPAWLNMQYLTGDRLDYAARRWHISQAMQSLRILSHDIPIWTNAPDATYLRIGRADYLIPWKELPDGTERADYRPAIESIRQSILKNGGTVAYFTAGAHAVLRRHQPSLADLTTDLHDLIRIDFPNDAIIFADPATVDRLRATPIATTQPAHKKHKPRPSPTLPDVP